jgi:hypothetical protein
MKQTVEEAARIEREKVILELHDAYRIHKDPKHYVTSSVLIQKYAVPLFKAGAKWQSKQSPWISVKERLPKHNIEVIICHEREFYIGKMYYSMQSNWWRVSDDEKTDMIVNEDDSWMPIPSFDDILEANKDVLERIKEKGD